MPHSGELSSEELEQMSQDEVVKATVKRLQGAAFDAVDTLTSVMRSPTKESSPAVKAAEGVLDRIGVPREQRLASGGGLQLPANVLAALVGGLAAMAGRALGREQLSSIEKALQERNVTPPPSSAGVNVSSAGVPTAVAPVPQAPPQPVEDPNLPLNYIANVEDEDLDHPADRR